MRGRLSGYRATVTTRRGFGNTTKRVDRRDDSTVSGARAVERVRGRPPNAAAARAATPERVKRGLHPRKSRSGVGAFLRKCGTARLPTALKNQYLASKVGGTI